MILNDFVLLAGDTQRTKKYLEALAEKQYHPSLCIVYYKKEKKISEDLTKLLEDEGFIYTCLETEDVNSEEMRNYLCSLKQSYIIYSGYGGAILKPHLFHLGKKFIHIHAGILPMYRGSTTAYYSILQENQIGATAIFMNAGIDEGDIITSVQYPIPNHGVDIDYEYEPYVRGRALIKVLELYCQEGKIKAHRQETIGAETYYIIHPVLKHIAILKCEKQN